MTLKRGSSISTSFRFKRSQQRVTSTPQIKKSHVAPSFCHPHGTTAAQFPDSVCVTAALDKSDQQSLRPSQRSMWNIAIRHYCLLSLCRIADPTAGLNPISLELMDDLSTETLKSKKPRCLFFSAVAGYHLHQQQTGSNIGFRLLEQRDETRLALLR